MECPSVLMIYTPQGPECLKICHPLHEPSAPNVASILRGPVPASLPLNVRRALFVASSCVPRQLCNALLMAARLDIAQVFFWVLNEHLLHYAGHFLSFQAYYVAILRALPCWGIAWGGEPMAPEVGRVSQIEATSETEPPHDKEGRAP